MTTLRIETQRTASQFPGIATLLSRGFRFKAQMGDTLSDFLVRQVGVPQAYVTDRIQTVFLNGRAVDDLAAARIAEGDTLSLSAAMPGLVGATFRKSGFYAELRKGISFHEESAVTIQKNGAITVRLFNFLAREIGPFFLARGILIPDGTLFQWASLLSDADWAVTRLNIDGSAAAPTVLLNQPATGKWITLHIAFS